MSIDKIRNRDTPSVIFIGGSGCGFGLISKDISEHFGMSVINAGTHAGLGLRLELELFKPYIRKGIL